jgi:hypothetical protein
VFDPAVAPWAPATAPELAGQARPAPARESSGSSRGGRPDEDGLSERLLSSTPPDFICPITSCLMSDPVIAADGFTYERTAVERWIAQSSRSPMTGAPLTTTTLVPNHALRSQISAHSSSGRHRGGFR